MFHSRLDTSNLRSRKPKTMVPYLSSNHPPSDDLLVSSDLTGKPNTPMPKQPKNQKIVKGSFTHLVNENDIKINHCMPWDNGGGHLISTELTSGGTGENRNEEQASEETTFIEGADSIPLISHEDSDTDDVKQGGKTETSISICLQVTLPYLIAGLGMVLAGLVLDTVQVNSFTYMTHHTKRDLIGILKSITLVSLSSLSQADHS